VLEQFIAIATWSLFVTLLVAVVGVAIPKIWVLAVDSRVWMWSWIGGSVGAGVVTAMIWTYCVRRSALEAAIEIDRRFGLKERVSSALALGPEERETEIGKALVTDTARRVERIDVKEKFRLSPNLRNALPLLPAAIVALLALLPNAVMKKSEAATEMTEQQNKAVQKKLAKIEQQLMQQAEKKTDDSKLEDGEFKQELAKKLKDLMSKENPDRKETLIKLSDLAKDIEKKKQQMGAAEDLKKELGKLKDIEKGPADKFAEALKEGDLGKAQEELKKLMEAAKKGELKEEDKQALAKQLEKMKEKIEEKKQQRDQAKKDLEEQVKQKMAAGDQAGAEKAQQKLDEMKQQEAQAQQKMEAMAQKLGEVAKAMKEGASRETSRPARSLTSSPRTSKTSSRSCRRSRTWTRCSTSWPMPKTPCKGTATTARSSRGTATWRDNRARTATTRVIPARVSARERVAASVPRKRTRPASTTPRSGPTSIRRGSPSESAMPGARMPRERARSKSAARSIKVWAKTPTPRTKPPFPRAARAL